MPITEEDLNEVINMLKDLWTPAVFRKQGGYGVDKSEIAEKINEIIAKVEALKEKI